MNTYTRNIMQTCTKSQTSLELDVNISQPVEVNLLSNTALSVESLRHSIFNGGIHWYLTYSAHHTCMLQLSWFLADPCILFKRVASYLIWIAALNVDDCLTVGIGKFLDNEESRSMAFKSKPGGQCIWCSLYATDWNVSWKITREWPLHNRLTSKALLMQQRKRASKVNVHWLIKLA